MVWEILARNSHYLNVHNCENVRKTSLLTMEKRPKLLKTEMSIKDKLDDVKDALKNDSSNRWFEYKEKI